jgi:hypothetical protein
VTGVNDRVAEGQPAIAHSTSRIEFFETMPISMIRGR